MDPFDTLWIDGHVATLAPGGTDDPYGSIPDGAVGVRGDRIAWVGRRRELPPGAEDGAGDVRSMGGGWLTPGLVDCHTHLVFGGDRAGEFERRLGGATYADIAREGGGIRATVRATRGEGEEALADAAEGRLRRLVAEGVTTVEVKSGYGLSTETELRMLQAARRLGHRLPVEVRTTLLAAHALPEEYEGRRDEYLALVRDEMIPRVASQRLAEQVDAFCESIAFTPAECEGVLEAGRRHGLGGRLHADQLEDGGGAAAAARAGARSADHLEHASEAGVRAMAEAGTVAVLLPGAAYFLGEETLPPVEAFRAHGVPMAVATDLNPGSSPVLSLLLMLNMGCTLFGLTPAEALAGATRVAASVLGLGADRGTVEAGRRADLAVWAVDHPRELAYWIGGNPLVEAAKDGVVRGAAALAAPRGRSAGET